MYLKFNEELLEIRCTIRRVAQPHQASQRRPHQGMRANPAPLAAQHGGGRTSWSIYEN
jgi:hypothetical protein